MDRSGEARRDGSPLERGAAPLILTLDLDEMSTDWFESLRRRWYPPGRNLVPAHLTLFHNLPGLEADEVLGALRGACRARSPLLLDVTGPWSLGRGVAYRLRSPELEVFRAGLADVFQAWLTPQDRAAFRAHVTVQNKAAPAEAGALLDQLQHDFEPFQVVGEGVAVWRYLGGPWEAMDRVPFSA